MVLWELRRWYSPWVRPTYPFTDGSHHTDRLQIRMEAFRDKVLVESVGILRGGPREIHHGEVENGYFVARGENYTVLHGNLRL